jgi:2-C-methyl-D-erythritol 4-phosphate cytidylyltransferase
VEGMMTTAILTAGGNGSRMQNNIPKQFITVNEIPILIYTLQQFQNNRHIDKIVVACIKEWQPVLRAYGKEFNISKLEKIVDGGATGIESIQNCFNTLEGNDSSDLIMIHDGNRPLVDDDIIEQNIEAAKKVGATTTYIDIHDGIVKVDDYLNIQKSDFKRDHIKSTQTPHCFKYETLKKIFPRIDNVNKYISLADAAANLGCDVALVKGSEINFKITTPNDLAIFEAIINTRFGNV